MTVVKPTFAANPARSRIASGALVATLGACSPHATAQSPTAESTISVNPRGEPSTGSSDNFTGQATVEPLFWFTEDRKGTAASVTFQPGARTTWHTHPSGQTLVVTQGAGWVAQWGQEPQAMRAGDVVWIPPQIKHWHGATATESMTHVAYQENIDGEVVTWGEHVSEGQYPNESKK